MVLSSEISSLPALDIVTRFPIREIVSIDSSDSVSRACRIFEQSKVTSVPVYDPKKQAVIGMIDMIDILQYLLSIFPKEITNQAWGEDVARELGFRSFAVATEAVQTIIGENVQVVVKEKATLGEVIEHLAKGDHRVPIVDENNFPIKIVSQSAVVEFLLSVAEKDQSISAALSKKLSELNLDQKSFLQVSSSDSTVSVMEKIINNGKESAIIVDGSGKAISNFSPSDLRLLKPENYRDLCLPVVSFLEKTTGKSSRPIISVKSSNTVLEISKLLVENKIHRVWIVDDNNKPTGVVTLTDVIRALTA